MLRKVYELCLKTTQLLSMSIVCLVSNIYEMCKFYYIQSKASIVRVWLQYSEVDTLRVDVIELLTDECFTAAMSKFIY
jgi:hypothetical protein